MSLPNLEVLKPSTCWELLSDWVMVINATFNNIPPFHCKMSGFIRGKLLSITFLYYKISNLQNLDNKSLYSAIVIYNKIQGPSLPWLYGSWSYNYLCNQCLSPLMLWVQISIRTRCTTLCDKVCQWLATGRWFSLGPTVSSTNKTAYHVVTEISLKVALNTFKQTNNTIKFLLFSLFNVNH
jgi:hypothetical protein